MNRTLAPDPIRVQSRVWCLFSTNRKLHDSIIYLSIHLIIQLEMKAKIGAKHLMEIFTSTETTVIKLTVLFKIKYCKKTLFYGL